MGKKTKYPEYTNGSISVNGRQVASTVKDKNNNIVSRHRLSDYNENFRIGEFPSAANGNFTVNFYFRQTSI